MSTAIIAGAAAGGAALLILGVGAFLMGSSSGKRKSQQTILPGEDPDNPRYDSMTRRTFASGISSKKHKKRGTKRRKSSGKGTKKK